MIVMSSEVLEIIYLEQTETQDRRGPVPLLSVADIELSESYGGHRGLTAA